MCVYRNIIYFACGTYLCIYVNSNNIPVILTARHYPAAVINPGQHSGRGLALAAVTPATSNNITEKKKQQQKNVTAPVYQIQQQKQQQQQINK